jgi:integrase
MSGKKTKDKWLPARVYKRSNGTYEYHPTTGGSVKIADANASPIEVLDAYEQIMGEDGTLGSLWEMYKQSERWIDLKPKTKEDYLGAWGQLNKTFGKHSPRDIKSNHVRKYMDIRTARTRANRERILLKNILRYGIEYNWLDSPNPCDVVKPFKETPRDRYVTDEEYQRQYERVSEVLQVFMELCYICGARGQDIRILKLSDIQEEGVLVVQQKTGKQQLKMWNPRLRAAVDRALEIRKARLEKCGHESMFLIVTKTGGPYSSDGLKANWQKSKYEGMDWTFHDLKAKAISDFKGDKQEFSGHKSRLQMEKYNRTADNVRVIDFSSVK